MDFILTRGYTICYATHQTWLQSQAWRTLLLPAYSAYSHSAYNSLSGLLERAKKDFTVMFLPLSPAKDSMFFELDWTEVQNKSRTIMAKSSVNNSCVWKRQPGPVNHWVLKRSQEEDNSFSRSYRNVLFITHLCLYDLQQTKWEEMQFPPSICGKEKQHVLRSLNEGLLNYTGGKTWLEIKSSKGIHAMHGIIVWHKLRRMFFRNVLRIVEKSLQEKHISSWGCFEHTANSRTETPARGMSHNSRSKPVICV